MKHYSLSEFKILIAVNLYLLNSEIINRFFTGIYKTFIKIESSTSSYYYINQIKRNKMCYYAVISMMDYNVVRDKIRTKAFKI